ncbi:MAG TPA: hypothetical protein VF043_17980 [Ktedonobacteraceae bacterium]
MTVVIHEFEVVSAPPAQQQAVATPPSSQPTAPAPTPQDVERIVRRQIERCARVRAH